MGSKTFLSLGEQIYQTLKERIIDNRYMPGTVLQIDKLAEEMGVSSTPIRETLFRLDGMGLVNIIRNKGAVVSGIDERMVRDVWQFRILLETFCACEALERIDKEALRNLKEKIMCLIGSPGDFELYKETDFLLHDMFSRGTDNALVRDALENIHDHSCRIRYFAESMPFGEEVVSRVTQEHLGIIEALAAGDPDAVKKVLTEHLTNGMERTMKALEETKRTRRCISEMAKKLKILVVCGFGIGSSLMLKMNIEKVLKENGLVADVATSDFGSSAATPCDIVFTSAEFGEKLKSKVQVPVVIVNNFVKLDEIRERGMEAIRKLTEQ